MLPLNQIIELDSAFISEAWQQGLSPDQDRFREDNVAISKDKAFLIRRHDYNHNQSYYLPDKSARDICSAAISELGTLKRLGLNVISFGLTPTEDGSKIFTVTKYITDLISCSQIEFRQFVAPVLVDYIRAHDTEPNVSPTAIKPYMDDIYNYGQYFKLIPNGRPILHDVEPFMRDDNVRLVNIHKYLSYLTA